MAVQLQELRERSLALMAERDRLLSEAKALHDERERVLEQINGYDIRFPATVTVHCPSGPVDACARHHAGLINVFGALGCHVHSAPVSSPSECINCVNENNESKHGQTKIADQEG